MRVMDGRVYDGSYLKYRMWCNFHDWCRIECVAIVITEQDLNRVISEDDGRACVWWE